MVVCSKAMPPSQGYPMPLYDLIADRYSDDGDIQRIVEQSGGYWNLVGGGGQTLRNRIHFALTYLARDPLMLTRLVAVVARDGYMNDDVARSVDELPRGVGGATGERRGQHRRQRVGDATATSERDGGGHGTGCLRVVQPTRPSVRRSTRHVVA